MAGEGEGEKIRLGWDEVGRKKGRRRRAREN
jgi:hypothetical protein